MLSSEQPWFLGPGPYDVWLSHRKGWRSKDLWRYYCMGLFSAVDKPYDWFTLIVTGFRVWVL
jgi:hypothetical protein